MPSYAICPLSNVPIRSNSSDKSEIVSQLLFGELAEVLETKGRQWAKIRCIWDNYVGWVAANQLKAITPSELSVFREHFAYSLELFQPLMADNEVIPVVMGARLPNFDGMRFALDNTVYTFSGQAVFPEHIKPSAEFILKIARRYLHAPFLHGGRSPMGIDAAGFTQMVFKIANIALPREAAQQVYIGTAVDFVEQSMPGDVAFFENRTGRITHCGIILPDAEVIHAFGSVRIDKIDHYGIYDRSEKRYTHRLRVVRRMLKTEATPKQVKRRVSGHIPNQVELF
ncbi:MAG: NlpC/P60 family protein [Phaeodactylibacter xiamenensis]|uniref:C40 family peptidase n=1 Tax=Phaeodactylibacter xiamenensis TaxID=1524460 RepID=UPI0005C5DB6C|nr:NlpC/P60 family protein [Phaeodactylibacter xiamenensis]MCR9054638.1 C40 family peptidase [bacterium]